MCKDPVGYNFVSYVMDQCYADAPGRLQPIILATVQQHHNLRKNVCEAFLAYTTDKMQNSLDTFFSELYQASDGVGDSVDYLLRLATNTVTQQRDTCSNYQTNPFVVAIIPEPVDYFRPCAYTTTCRMRCKPEIEAFEAILKGSLATSTTSSTTYVEAPFFLDSNEGSTPPNMVVLAATRLTSCWYACRRSDATDSCLALAGVPPEGDLTVMVYCVPTRSGVGVWRNNDATWTVKGSASWLNDVVDVQFLNFTAASQLAVLRRVPPPTSSSVVWFRSRVDSYSAPAAATARLSESRILGAFPEAQSITRILASPAGVVFVQLSIRARPTKACLGWNARTGMISPSCDHTKLWDKVTGGHVVWINTDMLAVVPGGGLLASSQGAVRIFNFSSSSTTGSIVFSHSIEFLSSTWSLTSGLPAARSDTFEVLKLPNVAQVSQYASYSGGLLRLYLVNPPSSLKHWLVEVRMSAEGAKTYSSSSIEQSYTMVQQCNTQSCNGCPSLDLMRLCYAAQQCTLVRCIGTLTNQNRPLCGLGQHVQALFIKAIASYQQMWAVMMQAIFCTLARVHSIRRVVGLYSVFSREKTTDVLWGERPLPPTLLCMKPGQQARRFDVA